MGSNERWLSYSTAFKVEVVNYAENNHEDDFSGSDDFLGFYDE